MVWLTEISEKKYSHHKYHPSKSGTLPGREGKDWMDMHLNYSLLTLDNQAIRLSFARLPEVRRD